MNPGTAGPSRLTARPFDPADALHWQRCAFPLALLAFVFLFYCCGPIGPTYDHMVIPAGAELSGRVLEESLVLHFPWDVYVYDLTVILLLLAISFIFPWVAMLTGQRTARHATKPVWGAGRRKNVARKCRRHSRCCSRLA